MAEGAAAVLPLTSPELLALMEKKTASPEFVLHNSTAVPKGCLEEAAACSCDTFDIRTGADAAGHGPGANVPDSDAAIVAANGKEVIGHGLGAGRSPTTDIAGENGVHVGLSTVINHENAAFTDYDDPGSWGPALRPHDAVPGKYAARGPATDGCVPEHQVSYFPRMLTPQDTVRGAVGARDYIELLAFGADGRREAGPAAAHKVEVAGRPGHHHVA